MADTPEAPPPPATAESLAPIEARTAAGDEFCAAARVAAAQIAPRAAAADALGAMDAESFRILADTGVSAATVPESLGGFGLTSIHDLALGIAAVAAADASVAIAINMHLGVTRGLAAASVGATRAGEPNPSLDDLLRSVAAGDALISATATEPGTDNLHPLTEAVPAADDTHVINGRKAFVTLSPVATHLALMVRRRDLGDHVASTMMPIDAVGVVPQDDWDAVGMRASGSQSIVLDNVSVPSAALTTVGPWGRWSAPMLMGRTLTNVALLGASVGIAGAAFDAAVTAAQRSPRVGDRPAARAGVQHLVAEMAVKVTEMRFVLTGATAQVDAFLAAHADGPPPLADAHRLMQGYQVAKSSINATAIEVVNKAMDVAGGSSFTNSSELSRLYRDVRAAPFMQPGAPAEARGYIGSVALGILPER